MRKLVIFMPLSVNLSHWGILVPFCSDGGMEEMPIAFFACSLSSSCLESVKSTINALINTVVSGRVRVILFQKN